MKFTDIFIKRPVLATVVNLLILLMGFRALTQLNVRQYPKSDIAKITIGTVYTGASADLVRGFITTPLEASIASADGIDYMTSSSVQGLSTITVNLKLNFDPNAALTQITAKINQVRNVLPQQAQEPTIKVQVGDSTAAMYLSFYSDQLNSNQITDYLTRVVQPKLVAVSGVQSAEILGARTYAMRIWLDPKKMASLNISPSDVSSALIANNFLSAVGATKGSMVAINLNASTDLHSAAEFKQLVVKRKGNTIIRLGDIANVDLGAEDYNTAVRFGGKNATFMGINVLPTANPLTVVKGIRKVFPEIVAQLPTGIHATIAYDSTIYIQDSIKEVISTLVEALLIVIVVIYLFLGSIRSVMIPIVTMPLALVGASLFMLVAGFSINLLTLLAMVLAIGLVVDDAIVVVENIHRHMEKGLRPFQAALKGAGELAGPVVAMSLTLAAVYSPIAFQGGLTGTLFKEFALTLVGAVLISGFTALTLSPMMCSKLLKHDSNKKGFAHWLDQRFDSIRSAYKRSIQWLLATWPIMLMIPVVAFLLIFPLWTFSQHELAPQEDQGVILTQANAAPNATLDQTLSYSEEITAAMKSFPETANIFQINGLGSTNTVFTGMVLSPWSERDRSVAQLMPLVQSKLSKIAGLQSFAFTKPPLPGAGDTRMEFVIGSTQEPLQIYPYANKLLKEAIASHNFIYGTSDLKYDQPQVDIKIDRSKAAVLGLNMQHLSNDVGSMLGGAYLNYFSIQGRSYRVIPQVKRVDRLNPDQVLNYYVSGGNNGKLIPLSSIAKIKHIVQPEALNRFQQLNSATLTLLPRPGISQGAALSYLQKEAKKILPHDYTIDYAGSTRQFVQESGGLVVTMLFAIIIIFLVLAAQFESFRDPLVILLGSVPMTIVGALIFLFLGASSVNIYTEVGLITLVGLISKHGILIVQFANQLQEEGMSKIEAIEEAAAVRLRPILMTTAAIVFGVLPLVIAGGPGAASRHDIGIVIVTGMTIGTFFTLFVVPSVYMLIAKDHHKGDRDEPPQAPQPPPLPGETAPVPTAG